MENTTITIEEIKSFNQKIDDLSSSIELKEQEIKDLSKKIEKEQNSIENFVNQFPEFNQIILGYRFHFKLNIKITHKQSCSNHGQRCRNMELMRNKIAAHHNG